MDRRDHRAIGPHRLSDRSVSAPLEYVSEVSHAMGNQSPRAQETQMPAESFKLCIDVILAVAAMLVLCSAGNREAE